MSHEAGGRAKSRERREPSGLKDPATATYISALILALATIVGALITKTGGSDTAVGPPPAVVTSTAQSTSASNPTPTATPTPSPSNNPTPTPTSSAPQPTDTGTSSSKTIATGAVSPTSPFQLPTIKLPSIRFWHYSQLFVLGLILYGLSVLLFFWARNGWGWTRVIQIVGSVTSVGFGTWSFVAGYLRANAATERTFGIGFGSFTVLVVLVVIALAAYIALSDP